MRHRLDHHHARRSTTNWARQFSGPRGPTSSRRHGPFGPPRLRQRPRTRGPLFLSERRLVPARRPAAADLSAHRPRPYHTSHQRQGMCWRHQVLPSGSAKYA
ncbi:hypothetical protein DP939_22825 [Spongiactinospora rosea]|uniref:Uncharacterized protein n=1 Tax=Spongiactinospora rosea TaxID=2248750 RepID=A0A366LWG2_9ACTN|nr:hypothetical protein DP939_22825 [Spongiactinospora rosea]